MSDKVNSQQKRKKKELKVVETVKRIVKRRQNIDALNKERSQFEEIRQLLEAVDDTDAVLHKSATAVKDHSLVPQDHEVTISPAPGKKFLHPSHSFAIFTEESLNPTNFFDDSQRLLRRPISSWTDSDVQKFLRTLVYELQDDWLSEFKGERALSLYVLHLLAVTEDVELIDRSLQFLFRFPPKITASDILPILANFGADLFDICGSDLQILIPRYLISSGRRRADFPTQNIESLLLIIENLAHRRFLLCDKTVKPLVIALINLSLDPNIRSNLLGRYISDAVNAILESTKANVPDKEVASWLIYPLEDEDLLNLLDICTVTLRPQILSLSHCVYFLAFKKILKANFKLGVPFGSEDLLKVLREINKVTSPTLLQLFAAFELLLTTLPSTQVSSKNKGKVLRELTIMENLLLPMKESSDLVRVRASLSKFHNLFTMATKNNLLC